MKIGNGVKPPSVIYSVDPDYKGQPGDKRSWTALVRFVVDEKGFPQKVEAVSCSIDDLCRVAVNAVRQYRFRPAIYEGHPVAVELRMDLDMNHF